MGWEGGEDFEAGLRCRFLLGAPGVCGLFVGLVTLVDNNETFPVAYSWGAFDHGETLICFSGRMISVLRTCSEE